MRLLEPMFSTPLNIESTKPWKTTFDWEKGGKSDERVSTRNTEKRHHRLVPSEGGGWGGLILSL